ncbi:MAG: TRAP transporter permease [Rhodospirillales bacterium]
MDYQEARTYVLLEELLRSRGWSLNSFVLLLVSSLSIALALFHIFTAGFGTPESHSFRSIHLVVMMVLAILHYPLFRGSIRDPLVGATAGETRRRQIGFSIDLALVAVVILIQSYILFDVEELQAREGDPSQFDIVIGSLLILMLLETTRRAVGWTMVFITVFFIAQTLYAPYFPGIFHAPPVSFERFVDIQFIRTDGIFGIPIFVVSTYILLFILFGSILIRSGAGAFFVDFAVSLTGHRTGGPAKAAVLASAFLGMVSGSATANVVTTGSFTIPMMKRLGYRARFAGAVEACASSGGQITPPIMGAAAFIIAEFMNVSYLVVITAAVIPALLYFATVYFMVHLEAEKNGIPRIPKEDLPRLGDVLRRGWHLLLSLVVLIGFLVAGFTATMAEFWTIGTLIVLSFINAGTRMSAVDIFAALEVGVRSTIPVTIACACAGIIIGSTFVSGFSLKFTGGVIDLAGGSLIVLLVLTGISAIILGMGITTTAVYITVATLIVPSLIEIGVKPMAAHMFAFYYGVVSSITPPVALASFAAAAIAGSEPMATAVESARIGVGKYLVPFVFVYNPSLVFEGPLWLSGYSALAALFGVWAMSVALEGWCMGRLNGAYRIAAAIGSLGLLYPPLLTLIILPGYVLNGLAGVGLIVFYLARARAGRDRALGAERAG